MKVGDKLYCCIDINDKYGKNITFSKIYNIVYIYRGILEIINDHGFTQGFYIDHTHDMSRYWYGNFFYTEQQLRKIKLQQLNSITT